MNMASQLAERIPLEIKFGSVRIAVIYILLGISGVVLSAVDLPRNGNDRIL